MNQDCSIVFLLDVDNTLLDNDRVEQDLRRHLRQTFGSECEARYWTLFERLRAELGYADYLGALQRYRVENPRDPHILEISSYLIDYPFANRLYPAALDVMDRLQGWGRTVILSDGDAVFQPRKIERSGLWETSSGHVLVYIHKEKMLEDIQLKYPAGHYVMVDDKLRILAAMKDIWKSRLTTVFVRQGHYAADSEANARYAPADMGIERIGDLLTIDLSDLRRPR